MKKQQITPKEIIQKELSSKDKLPKKHANQDKNFPIVGVGASAGGLEAFTQLLQNLSTDTGMALVLIQHLNPDHESILTSLLSKATSMPVKEVTQNLVAQPNHVYVIPPRMSLVIEEGILKLNPRDKANKSNGAIDCFFESLAQDKHKEAIGIVLSGTATDGSHGLKMIKSNGGITFAQDSTAKYNSMPHSAITLGCVDFVLSPAQIAKKLMHLASSRLSTSGQIASDIKDKNALFLAPNEEEAFKKILQLLQNRSGVDFSFYKSSTIQRRIGQRIAFNNSSGFVEYAELLTRNEKELDLLYSDMLISVTSFFRNPEAFKVLKTTVFPYILKFLNPEEPVRIWTLACSSGQEVYSIAMVFAEFCDQISRAPKLKIFATDLNEPLLEKARRGFYATNLVEEISPERLNRFFTAEPGGYRICKSVREMCIFAKQNVLSDPPFAHLDLITCRNLLIYLKLDLQKRVLPIFHYALKPKGVLFLGKSESIGEYTNLFKSIDKKQKIFTKNIDSNFVTHLPILTSQPASNKLELIVNQRKAFLEESSRTDFSAQREADRVMLSQFAPSSVLINEKLDILQFRGSTDIFLEPPIGKASFNILKMARSGLMLPLRAAIQEAKEKKSTVIQKKIQLDDHNQNKAKLVNLEVIPLKNLKELYLLVLFEEVSEKQSDNKGSRIARQALSYDQQNVSFPRIRELEQDLTEARDYARSLQEQHEAVNQELHDFNIEVQSANEELQSINEELETSKEELESTNEELITVNEEVVNQNEKLNRLNSDFLNLESSTNIPLVLLSQDGRIRRFSPLAAEKFNLITSDIGRAFGSVQHNLNIPHLETFIANVIAQAQAKECEVLDNQGHWYNLQVRPYLTSENKVDGAVLVLIDIHAIKKSEEALKTECDFSEAIIRTSRDPLLILDSDLRVEQVNEAFYTTFKVSTAESIGRKIYELDDGHWDIPKLRELLEEILPKESVFNDFEVEHNFEHIGQRTMLLNARILNEHDKKSAKILVGIQDVSKLLRFQKQLRNSERRYRRLFEAAKDGVLIIDPETRKILDSNPFMSRLLGYSNDQLIGKELVDIGLLKDKEKCELAFEKLKNDGYIRYEDMPLIGQNGQLHEVEFVSNLYQEGDEKVIQCNIRDVTERNKAKQELQEKARLLDLSTDAIIVCNHSDKIRFWNKGAEKLYGWSQKEVIGKNLHSLLQTEFSKPMEEIVAQLNSEGDFSDEVVQIVRDGRRLPSLCRWVLDRKTESILTTYTDITERKHFEIDLQEAKQIAEKANHAKSGFLANMSHEIRTPMNALIGLLELLQRTPLNEKQRDYVKVMSVSADGLLRIINDILDFSKVEAHKLTIETFDFNLTTTVERALEILRWEAKRKGIALFCNIDPNVCIALCGDAGRLQQILTNLISNAVKFTEQGEVILKVSLEDENKETNQSILKFEIKDTGIGITDEMQTKLFEAFSQAENSKTRKYGGTGLGLAISKQLVTLMGGEIGIVSKVNQGSTFWFTVSFEKQLNNSIAKPSIREVKSLIGESDVNESRIKEPKANELPSLPSPKQLRDVKILLAEDHPTNQMVITEQLHDLGYSVDTVSNGKKVLEALKEKVYDIILMDCQMPEMDGYEATKCIRSTQTSQTKQPYIIALTAYAMLEIQEKCLAAGMNDYVSKPIKIENLVKAMTTALSFSALPTKIVASQKGEQENDTELKNVPIIDLERFSNLGANKKKDQALFLTKIMKMFCDASREGINDISEAVKHNNIENLRLEIHRMKGASYTLGAQKVSLLCKRLEALTDQNTMNGAAMLVAQLKTELEHVEHWAKDQKIILE